eukprot:SAG22_NODE_13719_length_397_cov_0.624161_1_plen_37_part_01
MPFQRENLISNHSIAIQLYPVLSIVSHGSVFPMPNAS